MMSDQRSAPGDIPPTPQSVAGWSETVSAIKAAMATRPNHHTYTRHPVGGSAVVADMVIEGPEKVTVVEVLHLMAGTTEVSTSGLALATMVRESAQQEFPGKQVRIVFYSPTKLPESVREAAERAGAELASGLQTADLVRILIS